MSEQRKPGDFSANNAHKPPVSSIVTQEDLEARFRELRQNQINSGEEQLRREIEQRELDQEYRKALFRRKWDTVQATALPLLQALGRTTLGPHIISTSSVKDEDLLSTNWLGSTSSIMYGRLQAVENEIHEDEYRSKKWQIGYNIDLYFTEEKHVINPVLIFNFGGDSGKVYDQIRYNGNLVLITLYSVTDTIFHKGLEFSRKCPWNLVDSKLSPKSISQAFEVMAAFGPCPANLEYLPRYGGSGYHHDA